MRSLSLVVAVLFTLAVPASAAKERAAASPLVNGRLPGEVAPTSYTITLTVDPTLERFSGQETIELDVKRPTKVVVLHADGLKVTQATFEQGGKTKKARFAVVDTDGTATLTTDAPLAAGKAVLRISWDGAYDRTLRGLYKVVEEGRAYAFTQMEATSARKAFPCFDEPSFKVPLTLIVVAAKDDVVVANMPVLQEEVASQKTKRVTFQTTPPLPTYLFALAVGPLDVVDAGAIAANDVRTTPVPLRGIAAKGKGNKLAYALKETPAILASLEKWFGSPYPFAKLDLIAVPDFAAGAMENPGAITFKEQYLLIDPATAPLSQKKGFTSITAHELAHMWFGDLVTLAWWDDLWLNEAFATWMASKVVADVRPEYRVDLSTMDRAATAFSADSLASARKIKNPIHTRGDIDNSFDAITYQKGATVLAMFERWLGPAAFQKGVRAYLNEHAWGNATSLDLVGALAKASGKDVATPFSTFIDQSGLPQLEVATTCEGGKPMLSVAQQRWLPLGSTADPTRTWQVPFCVRTELPATGTVQTCTLLTDRVKRIPLPGKSCDPVSMPNAGADGYWRFSLPRDQLARLVDGRKSLSPRERVAVADAVRAAEIQGTLPFDDAWSLAHFFVEDRERASVSVAMDLLRSAREDLVPDRADRVDAAARTAFLPVAKRLGTAKEPGEDAETTSLRGEVLSFLALAVDDPETRKDLAARGRAWLFGKTQPSIDEELVDVSLAAAVREEGAPMFDAILARLAVEHDGMTRMRLIGALAAATDEGLRARARDLVLDAKLRNSEVPVLFGRLMSDPRARTGTLTWAETHVDALRERMPNGRRGGGLPRAFSRLCDEQAAARVQALFAPRIGEMVGGPRNLEGALESIRLCVAHKTAQAQNARRLFADQATMR